MEQEKLVEEFKETIANGNKASAVLGDGTDNAFRSMFQRGIFDNVPVFGFFVKACNVVSDIQAYRFCKKIYRFVFLTQDFDRAKMDTFWHEYATVNKENSYEMMLTVLDKVDNLYKVDVMARLLKSKLDGEISIENFIRLTTSLQMVPFVDLKYLPDYIQNVSVRYDTYMLLSAGLLYNTSIGVDGVGSKDANQYQLNDNGVLFVKYGLGVDVRKYVKSPAPISFGDDDDIDEIFRKDNPDL